MNIYFPNNIFTRLITASLPGRLAEGVKYLPGAMVTGEILKDESSVGLIPTFDLIKHKELFVSRTFGISFESHLCNSYLYFPSRGKNIENIYLAGDVTSNEAVGAKLILKELYSSEVELNLLNDINESEGKNVLLVGDDNFSGGKFAAGLSFAEEITEVLSLPYVNYLLVSADRSLLEKLHPSVDDVQARIYDIAEEDHFEVRFPETVREKIRGGLSSFICKLDDQDLEGIEQLLRLPFFHEIIQDIIEVNFV